MSILRNWELTIDLDAVLRSQGSDPEAIRKRGGPIVDLAEKALKEGRAYINPVVVYRRLAIESLHHERIQLEGGAILTGSLIVQHLGAAKQVVAVLCTIGDRLEERVSEVMGKDPAYGLALDGLGSAAVESLANAVCHHFETQVAEEGYRVSIPLSPGMMGWPVEVGQEEIFDMLGDDNAGVRLTSSSMMIPRKSLTMVLGFGPEVGNDGHPCDYCSMRETCRYKTDYCGW
ncbi:MAG: hypothetical protein AMJ88_12910 [Anaerolineae bacterium SM23_ 63]|nr:MAG: hypothetical protein AMJ88_12910 [Anaerolineae bacterium SM23_ 63]HEY47076.1 hypothetical protein [Anaerolineae bacterium]